MESGGRRAAGGGVVYRKTALPDPDPRIGSEAAPWYGCSYFVTTVGLAAMARVVAWLSWSGYDQGVSCTYAAGHDLAKYVGTGCAGDGSRA